MSEPDRSSLESRLQIGQRLAALLALSSVWLTTAGHTASFREMDAAHGWVTTDGYSLHSAYLFSIAAGLAFTWANRPLGRPSSFMRRGLSILAIGSFVNGLLQHAPLSVLAASRMAAGFGAGMVLASAPLAGRAAGSRWFTWTGIILPSLGPIIIAWAADIHREQGWEGSFLFEGFLASVALILVVAHGHEDGESGWPAIPFWYPLFVGLLWCIWYTISYGQLEGWSEDRRCAIVMITGGLLLVFLMAIFVLNTRTLQLIPLGAWPTLALASYAGFVQFFNVTDISIYGGLLIDLGKIDRSLLIWPISLGAATAMILARLLPTVRSLTPVGLIFIFLGMGLAHSRTMGWTFWAPLNQVQFNWFPAPGLWELAPARFLMGLGTSLTLIGLQRHPLPLAHQEEMRLNLLTLFQFLGGALSIGVLTLCTTRLYQYQYSFVAERGYIQPEAYSEYGGILDQYLQNRGFPNPAAGTRSLLHNSVVYESNNLVFAAIYGWFQFSALILFSMVLMSWGYGRLQRMLVHSG